MDSIMIVALIVGGVIFSFVLTMIVLWVLLRDKLIFNLKQRLLPRGGKLHVIYHYREGTQIEDIQSVQKIFFDGGIFFPGDAEKNFRIQYLPSNERDSLGLPVVHCFEGISITPTLSERYEQSLDEGGQPVYEPMLVKNEQGEVVQAVDDSGEPLVQPKMTRVIGAGFSSKKSSELANASVKAAFALGTISRLKDMLKSIQQNPLLFPIVVLILVVCIVNVALVYGMADTLNKMKPVIEGAVFKVEKIAKPFEDANFDFSNIRSVSRGANGVINVS